MLPNRKLDRRSGSPHVPNFEPDFGPVRKGSGSNHSSELNLAITNKESSFYRTEMISVDVKVDTLCGGYPKLGVGWSKAGVQRFSE